MPRKKNPKPNPVGCPPKAIDWDRVDKLLRSGCPGVKIAASLGISANTLYDRCVTDKGVSFSHYSQQNKEVGDGLLHEKQFDQALEGDTTLLIWLGKTRLEQKESAEVTVIAPAILNQFDKLMNQFTQAQSLNIDSNKTISE